MACAGCERRRKEMAIMLEATKAWTANPVGPNVMTIYQRLREEAISKGELSDGIVGPTT